MSSTRLRHLLLPLLLSFLVACGGSDGGRAEVSADSGGVDVEAEGDSGGLAVESDEDGVRIDASGEGGDAALEIGEDGVKLEAPGVSISLGGGTDSEDGEATPIANVDRGDGRCLDGNCTITCESGTSCEQGCVGGGCTLICEPGATCTFTCIGGDCVFQVAEGAEAETSCVGGGCTSG